MRRRFGWIKVVWREVASRGGRRGSHCCCEEAAPVCTPCPRPLLVGQTCGAATAALRWDDQLADQLESARSSCTFGPSSRVGSLTGSPVGLKTRTSAPISSRSRAHSCASRREKLVSRSEPYSTRIRGLCVQTAFGGRKWLASAKSKSGSCEHTSLVQSDPGPLPITSISAR